MAKFSAIWRIARLSVLGLAVAVVVGLAVYPAEADWRWNGYTYVWVTAPYHPLPPAYDYSPPPTYAQRYYGPSIGLAFPDPD